MTSYTGIAGFVFQRSGVHSIDKNGVSTLLSASDGYLCSVIEIFASHASIERAYGAYQTLRQSAAAIDPAVVSPIKKAFGGDHVRNALVFINHRVLVCSSDALPIACQIAIAESKSRRAADARIDQLKEVNGIVDLTGMSRATNLVANTINAQCVATQINYPDLTLDQFRAVVKKLFFNGFLTATVGAIDFGDFRRLAPFCPEFGLTRGTPIDRYYLNRFIERIRGDVVGDTLEVGGIKENQRIHGFERAATYRTLDVTKSPGVDIAGDVHDEHAVVRGSVDSIIIFNVLEHCERPWVVVDNLYQWLRNGGKVFCMVPNAQRLHNYPGDFWRFLPDAIRSIFSRFYDLKLFLYGNPIAAIASMMGIAAEELSREELDPFNEEYLVATCVEAQKAAG